MATREKLAWLLLTMAVTALAVAAFSPAPEHAPAALQPAAPFTTGEVENQLARIEARMARLESATRAAGRGSTSSATATAGANPDRSPAGMPETSESMAPPDTQATVAMEQSRIAASALVDRAVQAGNWTRKDAEAWMAASAGMRAEDRFALVRRLVVEVDHDRLRLEPGANFH